MKIFADTHCHTIASTHAYSTVVENVVAAKKKGLKAIAITDHAPAMPDAPHIWHFENLTTIPRKIDGITVLRGAEVNICDYDGGLDLSDAMLKSLDWVVASLHAPVCPPSTEENVTRTYLKIAENPYIDVIGHSGQEKFKYDYEKVIPYFKECGKIVELNEGSARVRRDSFENCIQIAKLCKKYNVPVVVNSDAHFASVVGEFTRTLDMLDEIDFPEELVINADIQRLYSYISDKRGIDFNSI